MTFSIVGYDPETGEIGIAVHSKAFSVGSLVPFVKAGIGAVATQSLVNVSLGAIGLELFEEGRNPAQALEHFRSIDTGIEYRQLGMFSVKHGSFSFTGESCIGYAGGITGENYAIQGNILTGPEVIQAMADAFENGEGTLADRLFAAIKSGNDAGGDARGEQSAAIVVEHKGQGRANYGDRKIDLRVEDADDPISELKRLLDIRQTNIKMQEFLAMATEDVEKAIEHLVRLLDGRKDRWLDEAWISLGRLYYLADDKQNAKVCINTALELQPGMIHILKAYPRLGLGFDEEFVNSLGE